MVREHERNTSSVVWHIAVTKNVDKHIVVAWQHAHPSCHRVPNMCFLRVSEPCVLTVSVMWQSFCYLCLHRSKSEYWISIQHALRKTDSTSRKANSHVRALRYGNANSKLWCLTSFKLVRDSEASFPPAVATLPCTGLLDAKRRFSRGFARRCSETLEKRKEVRWIHGRGVSNMHIYSKTSVQQGMLHTRKTDKQRTNRTIALPSLVCCGFFLCASYMLIPRLVYNTKHARQVTLESVLQWWSSQNRNTSHCLQWHSKV